jgi:hypothetical protein
LNQLGHSRQLSFPVSGWVDPGFEALRSAFVENSRAMAKWGRRCTNMAAADAPLTCGAGGRMPRPNDPGKPTRWSTSSRSAKPSRPSRWPGWSARAGSYDEPVARAWPQFGAQGKSAVTVCQLLSHQAGLPAIRADVAPGLIFDWPSMCEALAAHEPWWEPGTAHGYHVNTFGFLVGELVRRVSGQTIGRYMREQIAAPLEADFPTHASRTTLGPEPGCICLLWRRWVIGLL